MVSKSVDAALKIFEIKHRLSENEKDLLKQLRKLLEHLSRTARVLPIHSEITFGFVVLVGAGIPSIIKFYLKFKPRGLVVENANEIEFRVLENDDFKKFHIEAITSQLFKACV